MLNESTRVAVYIGTTAIRVACTRDGRFPGQYRISVYPFLKHNVIEYEFDKRQRRNIPKYCYYKYDHVTGYLYIPIGFRYKFIEYLRLSNLDFIEVEDPPIEAARITCHYTGTHKDRPEQALAIQFTTSDQYMKALELQTGKGKTYIAIRTILKLGYRTIVVVPAFLMEQWTTAITSLSDAVIYEIRGIKSIIDLVDAHYEVGADIFLASINTLQDYASGTSAYRALPVFSEFMANMRFGVKVLDECHLNFNANTLVDIQCRIRHNLYLSATYMRSASSSNRIFRIMFPNEVKYGGDEYSRYVNITEVRYSLGDVDDKLVSTDRGYSQFKYEKYLLRKTTVLTRFMSEKFIPIVEDYFISIRKPRQKLLILVGLRDFAEVLVNWLSSTYPDVSVTEFLQDTPDEALSEADIIVSTIGSSGTGRDIPHLRTVILFVSFGSEVLTYQTLGRLRMMEDTPEFVYMVNTGIWSHRRHAQSRRAIYQYTGKQFKTVVI